MKLGGSATPERLVPVLVVATLFLGLPAALVSPVIAVLIAAATALLLMVGLLGLDRTSLWTMVAAFALAPSDTLVIPGLEVFGVSDALFFASIALALPRLFTQRIWLPLTFVTGSLAFVAISALSNLQASDPFGSYYYCARVIFTMIGIPALLVWWAPRGRVLVALVLAFAVGTGVSVLVGLPDMGSYRNYGLTQHPNALGYTAVLSLSLLPFLTKALDRTHRFWICAAVFGVAFLGIMSSGSRAALVVALVLIALVPAAERSILAGLTVLGSGLVAILVLVDRVDSDGGGQDALSRLLGSGDVAGSNRERVQGVERVWALALDHPFVGSGFTFSDFVAHNVYVQIAAAAGFLGLAAFAVICGSMITPLFVHDDVHSRLVYPAIVFLIAGPVSPNLTDRYIGILLGLSLVGVVAVHENRRGLLPGGAMNAGAGPDGTADTPGGSSSAPSAAAPLGRGTS